MSISISIAIGDGTETRSTVKCKQWQLGDIYIHFRHFKVGRIDDIYFFIKLHFGFILFHYQKTIIFANTYVPKNGHVFVIQNGADENRRKLLVVAIVVNRIFADLRYFD